MARTSVASQSRAHVPFTAARALRTAAARRHAPHAALRRTHTIGSSRSSVVVRATWATLDDAVAIVRSAPAQMKQEAAGEVLEALKKLKQESLVPKWGKALEDGFSRRSVSLPELKMVGVKDPGQIAKASVRNDLAFLVTVVGTTSVLAVAASFLPGDWGFFVPYLTGGISIAVLAVGSTAPGLLSFAIDRFSQLFPDYRERVLLHVPVVGYDIGLGREHTDLAEAKLQARLFQSKLSEEDVNQLAVVAMAGVAAEAMALPEVQGQQADLADLQRILNRAESKLSNAQQQNATRWAVWQACSLLRAYTKEHQALIDAMKSGASVADCVRVIESA